MKVTSALEKMSSVASKFDTASDLMQSAANDTKEDKVEVKEKEQKPGKNSKAAAAPAASPKKEKADVHTMSSRSRPEAKAVKNYNEHNQTTINKHLPANDDGQTERQNKQIALAQQQAISMKQLNSTMKEILTVLESQKNKITPKTQEFAKSKGFAEVIGQAKDGMIDKIGSLLGDLMGDFKSKLGDLGDMLGGKDKKGGKKKGRSRSRDKARAARREASRIRAGGAPGAGPSAGGGWWSNVGERLKGGLSSARGAMRGGGGGRVGTALKIGAGIATAVGGYEGVKWLGGKLGMVSKSEESGKGGVGTVSSGKGDNGGVSYGSHQLSSKTGSMTAFLQSKDGQPYAQQLSGLQPGSAAFSQKYKEIASSDGENFEKAQDQYLQRTHYDPQVKKVSQDTGMDFSKKGRAVQEMLYSTGIQYGPGSGVVSAALKGKNTANMSDSEIVQTVQDYKSATTGQYFSSSDSKIQQSVANRALREKAKLLAMDKQELEAKASGAKPDKTPPTGVSMADAANDDSAESTVASAAPVQNSASLAAAPEEGMSDITKGILVTQAAGIGGAGLAIGGKTGYDLLTARPAATPSLTPAPVATPSLPAVAEPHVGSNTPHAGAAAAGERGAAAAAGKGIVGRTAAKVLPGANIAFGALDAYDVITDEDTTRAEKEKGLAGVGGGMAGAAAGASAGTAAGTAIGAGIGSLFFGVGAVPGAVIGAGLGLAGGAVGGYFGYNAGQAGAEGLYDAALGSPEEQAAKQEADAAKPVAGSTPLMMLTQKKADETGDPAAVSAAAAMKTVDDAIKKSTAAISGVTDKKAEKDAAAKAAAPETPAATPEVKGAGAVASSSPQTPGDMNTMLAGAAATGVAAGIASAPSSAGATAGGLGAGIAGALAAGLGLPPGWAESITSGYGDALAAQAQAMGSDAVLPTPGATPKASSPVTVPPPSPMVSMPKTPAAPPVVTAPQPSQPVAPTSPASADFYKDQDIAPSASSLAASSPASSVSRSASAPTTVSSTATAPEPVQRQQYEPVKSVMMIEPKTQDTLMPQRMQPAGSKISSKGVSEGNSVRQTLDDAPAVITDQGLVMLQVGFI